MVIAMNGKAEKPTPNFAAQSGLTRYIREPNRMKSKRVSSTAFHRDLGPSVEHFLSVNSLEVESIREISDYYRGLFQRGIGKVAVSVQKIRAYNAAASAAALPINYNKANTRWEFTAASGSEEAYKHRPGRSPSHCGVEYVKVFNDHQERKYARRLAKKNYDLL
jgi:hypothetical protein